MEKTKKEFGLTTLSLNSNTTVFVLTFIITILGLISYINLPKENFPEVKIPTIYVGTPYPGNSPVDIENLITRPLEKEINQITNVNKITSNSVQDFSSVVVEFDTKVEAEEALRKVKDAVDKAKKDLPNDLDNDPDVFEINFSEFPIMNINLYGDYSNDRLNDYGEYLKDEIEKLPEISYCRIRGVDKKEVKIDVDLHKMESLEISFDDVEKAVSGENLTISGGNFKSNGDRRSIRVIGEFTHPSQLLDVIVKDEKFNIVYLREIATVTFDYKEAESYARLGTQAVIMVDVVKRSGENLISVSDKIYAILEKAKKEVFPKNLEISITNNQSDVTLENVSGLENNIISGVILVVIVLLFFLGTRNALFVGMAIPLSMFLSFIVLGALGITINMMVLFGLIMALGMLVDNGIVVVENVYRLREQGYSPYQAAKEGVGEVAFPIISSTATTLAAFLPLAFWPGIMGNFMQYLPITLIIGLGSSLFVALVINPVFLARFIKIEDGKPANAKQVFKVAGILVLIGALLLLMGFKGFSSLMFLFAVLNVLNAFVLQPASFKFQNTVLPALERRYERVLRFAVSGTKPRYFFFGTVVMFFLSFVLLGIFTPKVLFFPENEPNYVNIFIEMPVGTDIQTTNEITEKLEKRTLEIVAPYQKIVESVIANVGEGTSDPGDPTAAGESNTPHKARITVAFLKYRLRDGLSTTEVMEKIRTDIGRYPGVTITVDKEAAGPPVGKPISIELVGEDIERLAEVAERMEMKIRDSDIAGIEELKSDLETGKPEFVVEVDREKARRLGVSTYMIASTLRTSLFGKEVSKYKEGEDDYPIFVRLDAKYRHDPDILMNQKITFRDMITGQMRQVPISSVAKAAYSSTYGSVRRKDLDRVISLTSNVVEGYNATEINDKIKILLADFDMPPGYSFRFTGEQEKQAEEMAFLSRALLIALFLILLIIVAQFNKISAPVIILSSVLFSTIGVFLGLIIFQMEFIIIMTMIGIISLAGIVVNNAIVLIDFIELIRARRREDLGVEKGGLSLDEVKDVIVEAGKTRLRPVLLTAITTVLGLIPLAVGINIDFIGMMTKYDPDFYIGGDNVIFWGPMSWTIIFGLIFATFLTLVIVPVMYLLVEKIKRGLNVKS